MNWKAVSNHLASQGDFCNTRCQEAAGGPLALKYSILADLYYTLSIALLQGDPTAGSFDHQAHSLADLEKLDTNLDQPLPKLK